MLDTIFLVNLVLNFLYNLKLKSCALIISIFSEHYITDFSFEIYTSKLIFTVSNSEHFFKYYFKEGSFLFLLINLFRQE